VLQALVDLQEQIKKGGTLSGREFAQRVVPEGPPNVDVRPVDAVVAPGDYRTAQQQWEELDISTQGAGLKTTFPEAGKTETRNPKSETNPKSE
jgi:hypothetical protein